ncbi:sulfite oxidase heme-binding subunit YedZ [Janthinobacterium agaricidamnosum]|uniref:Protein-methionine-sulfoxide reductase heme-binding subunit MsrQ n=1 Tax=Janthinobacterium agaricidamnosum NBRC 102515 = DSM 9628 TaxID=1349767 RepID=W0VCY6_9BURK|nr:protein-methionine-sulfoxide reductase heme-binding subunit MsrQ [Janthinobacterium agaricidamnosum]CDG85510.1 ferric reductase like transmembrane component family protein [Janthinobacterium agaricidamnosum NBRC 102515 = DSM 9628]
MPFTPAPKQLSLLKAVIFVLALIPFVRMVWLSYTGQLVEPLEFITRGTGDWTLYFLCISLAVTPLRRIAKWNWLIKLRRMLGLFAFFYGALHFTTFLWFDHFFDIAEMWADVLKRPFITVGFIAFILLIPLAVTSTNGMVRRLGGKRWQWLHRLIYVIAPLGILHFWWMKAGKHNFAQPILFGLIVALLLAIRVYYSRAKKAAVTPA